MDANARRYPVGIQAFERIRKDGHIYIDKTDLVWRMVHESPFVFLCRPRRFGKSLLTSTLESYFKGDRDLFEGLRIMGLEKDWEPFPVIRLDVSSAGNKDSASDLRRALLLILKPYAALYGRDDDEITPGEVLAGLIRRAYEQTGRQVAVLVDEYDAPLLDVLHEDARLPEFRHVMQEFYQPLKAGEAMIRFCFITGITKFSQLSIFSTINNLTNISLHPRYSAICGITEEELSTCMAEDIALLARAYDCSPEMMHERLKQMYDGYRFSKRSVDIYNPFSLLKAFLMEEIDSYWFESGTPSYPIRQMQRFRTDISEMDHLESRATAFDRPRKRWRMLFRCFIRADTLPSRTTTSILIHTPCHPQQGSPGGTDRRVDSCLYRIPALEATTRQGSPSGSGWSRARGTSTPPCRKCRPSWQAYPTPRASMSTPSG